MIEVCNKFELEVQLKKSKRALGLFHASWCPYCRSFLSVFKKNTAKGGFSTALSVKVDDYDSPLWDEYSIGAVPTVILFDEGKVRRRLDGRFGQGLNEKQLNEWLKAIQEY